MRRTLATLAVTAAVLSGGLAVGAGTASAAASVGWCDGTKSVTVTSSGNYVLQPYHKGTGSRNCTLAEGAEGGAVSALQRALRECNFSGNLVVDGDFGPATRKAVTYAQYRRGIGQDGIYGPQSRQAFTWPTYWSNGKPNGKCASTG